MSGESLLSFTLAQRDCIAFVDLRLRFSGEIRRQDMMARFAIQMAAGTRDFARYKEFAVGNLEYDTRSKVFVEESR